MIRTFLHITTLTLVPVAALAADNGGRNAAASSPRGALLAASFGVDDFAGLGPCAGQGPIDGLPVVFDRRIDGSTIDVEDFVIVTASGERVQPQCATFLPSVNRDERQTILTQGLYGAPGASPVAVEIVGSIRSEDGAVDYRGTSIGVVPFEVGAILVYARSLPLGGQLGGLDQCPAGTAQVIQLAFGSNAGNNFPVIDAYLQRFRVVLEDGTVASPFVFGDATVDNYLELCLIESSPAVIASVDAQTINDAAGQLNQVALSAFVE